LFASAAEVFGANMIAVVLTGRGEDGAAGLSAVRQAGGTVIAEDPVSAEAAGMPAAAIATGCVDTVVPLAAVSSVLRKLVQGEPATA
jgi:two-component system chemotaxis response regulator CheB